MYTVDVDWAQADELVISLKAFLGRREHKTLDLSPAWAKSTRESLTPSLLAQLSSVQVLEGVDLLDHLIRRCPGERSASGYIEWLAEPSPGQLFEWLAPGIPPKRAALLTGLGAMRDRYVTLLRAWNDQYFSGIDTRILDGLERDATEKRTLREQLEPDQLVERATSGVQVAPGGEVDHIWLIPQYHYRPWNVNAFFHRARTIYYPMDGLPLDAGDISPRLRRLTRALADDSRLHLLRLLSTGPRGFTELVAGVGLAKSTVNHHLVVLRAAGLVRVHDAGDGSTTYTLRPEAIDALGDDLRLYLRPD